MSGMKNKPLIFLDTNIFIYHFEGHEIYGPLARAVFQKLERHHITARASVLTQLELLSIDAPQKQLDILIV
jgi:predicted nucleic acid-binding protein